MSAPRPYWTDPFHPLGSISNMKQFLYIYNNVPVISSMWYVQCLYMTIAHVQLYMTIAHDPESFKVIFSPKEK